MPSVHTVTLVPLVALLPFQWDNQTGRFLLSPAPSPPLALLLSCVLLAEYEMQDGWLLSQPAHPQPPKPFCAVVFGWQYHPDKQAAGAAVEAEERTRRFLEIHQAWKVLGNEETKQEYDLQQRGRFLPRSAGVAAALSLSQGLGVVVRWCFKMLFSAERNAAFTPVLLSGMDPLFIA